ncbi:MAG: hypothetical protein ACK4M6_01070 [Hyphomonas sp.]
MSTLLRLILQFLIQAYGWLAACIMTGVVAGLALRRLRDAPLRSYWIKSSHMTITSAAKLMYNKSGSHLKRFAINEAGRNSFSAPSKYYEGCLIVAARQRIVTLYGAREQGLMHEPISQEYMDGVYESRDGNFESFWGESGIEWYDVRVSRKDAIRALREFEVDEVNLRLA